MGPYEYQLKEMRKRFAKEGKGVLDPEFNLRRTGRTTGQVLFILGSAMREPGVQFRIRNHTTGGKLPTREMDIVAFGAMRDLVQKLELEFFTLDRYELTVVYNPPKSGGI